MADLNHDQIRLSQDEIQYALTPEYLMLINTSSKSGLPTLIFPNFRGAPFASKITACCSVGGAILCYLLSGLFLFFSRVNRLWTENRDLGLNTFIYIDFSANESQVVHRP